MSKGGKGQNTLEDLNCFHKTSAVNHIEYLAAYFRQGLHKQCLALWACQVPMRAPTYLHHIIFTIVDIKFLEERNTEV